MINSFLTAYLYFVTAVLGLVFGSFGNAWAWRIVHKESIARGRSHCATCGHTLGALDLIPLVSYLLLRGRCRYCGKKISLRYPAAEALCAAVFLSAVLRFGFTPYALSLCVLGFCLLTLSLCDLECCLIPDRFPAISAAVFAAYTLLCAEAPVSALLRGVGGGLALAVPLLLLVLLFDHLMGRETMGGGDIKLLFVLGLYTGAAKGLFMLILACVIGLGFALVPSLRGKNEDEPRAFPFGPALALAAWVTLLAGDAVLAWYWGLF